MQKISKTYFTFLLVMFTTELLAQNDAITEPQLMLYKRQQYGINLNSTGLGGINYMYGWQNTGSAYNMLDFELARIRHYKEFQSGNSDNNGRQYTFGRRNMAFFLRTGYGQNMVITERPYKNAISVRFNYSFGITTAILKPVYLDVQVTDPKKNQSFIVSKQYDPNSVNQSDILGNSSFTSGLGELKFYPGGYGRAAISVEWGAYPDEFKSLEAGIVLDTFLKPLPLMAFTSDQTIFFGLFLEFSFGYNN